MIPRLSRTTLTSLLLLRTPLTLDAFLHPPHSRSLSSIPRTFSAKLQTITPTKPLTTVSSSLMEPSPPPEEDQDPLKWERIYASGNTKRNIYADPDDEDIVAPKSAVSEVRVITFDLDNTLWKTPEVIGAANDALAAHLDASNIQQPKRAEVIMGQLFKADMARYAPILNDSSTSTPPKDAGPVYLTQLRKDALMYICKENNGFSESEAEAFANEAFEVWTNARHASIPSNFATSVVPCLQQIRDMKTSEGDAVIVGAVTDGNSNPLTVPELKPFFDFCINAESVGVSKPDRKIYETAITQVSQMESLRDIFGSIAENSDNALSQDMIEDLIGPWWIHIGDHFMKDIVAAKGMNMRTIWARELVLPKEMMENLASQTKNDDKSKKKDVTEFVKEISKMKTIQMNIGAEDFLLSSVEKEFADAVVYTFPDLFTVLSNWQEEAVLQKQEKAKNIDFDPVVTLAAASDEMKDIFSIVLPDDPSYPKVTTSPVPQSESSSPTTTNSDEKPKFCMSCGTKLPQVAKFCSACGEKQPEV